jgi:prepilin-type processing-associated H-X9-DG protein
MLGEDAGRPTRFVSRLKVPAQAPLSLTTSDGWGWADTGNSGAVDGCTFDGSFVNGALAPVPPAVNPTCPIPANCQAGATCFINCNSDSELFSFHAGGIHALFADGHVVFLNQDMSAQTLAALLTRNAKDIPGEY